MTSTIKQAIRSVKETVLQYSEIEIKVRNATNNDKWGVSSSAMSEIARATSDYQEYPQLFAMLWKRLNDVEHVMHVYKALILVEYLLRNGAERFINDAKRRSRDIAQLTKYKHYDENNRDDAVEARNKAKQVYQLLTDEQRLKEERQKAIKIRDVKMSGFGNDNGYSIGGGVDYENNDYGNRDRSHNGGLDLDENNDNNEYKAETVAEQTEKPKKKKTPKHDSNGQSAEQESSNPNESAEKKKKKKKKKPVEGSVEEETHSKPTANPENVFGFDASRDPFGSNDDPFAAAGFSQKPIHNSNNVSAADYPGGPTPVPVSIPNRLPTVSQTVQQQNAIENPNPEKKKKKKKDKEASNVNNNSANNNLGSASAAYAAQVQSDPFSSNDPFSNSGTVNYDLSSFSGPTYVGDKNIDILTGLHATAHQSGDLADVFATTSLTDNTDPFTADFNKSNKSNTISNNTSKPHNTNANSQPPKRDVWDLATEIANIDNIHAAPVQKKAEKKEEISMSMMRSMQPLGVSHDMLQQQEQRQVPKSNIMPTPAPSVSGYNLPLMPNNNPQQLYMQSNAPMYAPAQPMLMLMAPGAAPVPAPAVYAGQIPMYAPQQAPVQLDPFSNSISPTGGFGRRNPAVAYNSKGPIIFESVPEKRNDPLQTSPQSQPIPSAAPAGPNWNRY